MQGSGARDQESGRELRKFGLSVGSVFVAIATLLLYRQRLPLGAVLLGVGALLITTGLLRPLLLKRVNWAWMKLAHLLGYINTRIILGVVFFVLFAPVGIVLRLMRVDLLERQVGHPIKTYWKTLPKQPQDAEQYQNPF